MAACMMAAARRPLNRVVGPRCLRANRRAALASPCGAIALADSLRSSARRVARAVPPISPHRDGTAPEPGMRMVCGPVRLGIERCCRRACTGAGPSAQGRGEPA